MLSGTTIGTLRIRGPAGLHDGLSRALQQADWPDAGGEQVVFVRRIRVAGYEAHIGPALLEQVRQSINRGETDNVVRFANRREMLAALLADLAQGVAAGRWYWRRWARLFPLPPSQALYSVLADHPAQLNGLAECLAARQQLARVWRTLSDAGAEQLIRELCWQNGYRPTAGATAQPDAEVAVERVPRLPPRIRARWQPALQEMSPDSPRLRLAALLIAQETVPLMLLQSTDATLAAVAAQLSGRPDAGSAAPAKTSHSRPSGPATRRPAAAGSEPAFPPPTDTAARAGETAPLAASPTDSRPVEHRRSDIAGTPGQAEQPPGPSGRDGIPDASSLHPLARLRVAPEREPLSRPSDTGPTHTELSPSEPVTPDRAPPQQGPTGQSHTAQFQATQFQSRSGGALYLLNFLDRPPLQSIMGDYWQSLPSGWIWLYRTAQLLELDDADPLLPFLAAQLGLDDRRALERLPSLPERDRIEALAHEWYAGLWQPSLLRLPALIRYSASHLDMHTALSHTRLDVRLAGLDLNPGWLPWLGRVVQFHFEPPAEQSAKQPTKQFTKDLRGT